MKDAWEQEHGYNQEVFCDNCPESAVVRFWEGEAVYASDLDCECGGRFEVQ
jgi:hypothetical protein